MYTTLNQCNFPTNTFPIFLLLYPLPGFLTEILLLSHFHCHGIVSAVIALIALTTLCGNLHIMGLVLLALISMISKNEYQAVYFLYPTVE